MLKENEVLAKIAFWYIPKEFSWDLVAGLEHTAVQMELAEYAQRIGADMYLKRDSGYDVISVSTVLIVGVGPEVDLADPDAVDAAACKLLRKLGGSVRFPDGSTVISLQSFLNEGDTFGTKAQYLKAS